MKKKSKIIRKKSMFGLNKKICIVCGKPACQLVFLNKKYTDFCKFHKISRLINGEFIISDNCMLDTKISNTYYTPKKYI